LKPLAKAALPIAGRALGAFVVDMIGGKLASAARQMFGELAAGPKNRV